ncbi:hypothetical protein [Anaeromyxobacter sp. PSR-1]|uniref:SPW repeat domain-containing protein n=1 Tax=unclassified Anaeromyxobacter TaxID=2620896 RepID=UPI0005DD1D51|nr:hypothetical protein [Anaeromyxobacter sp. PSR-1]GAO03994.1 hypothetical protein PSR1_02882 [Anaeromyxobacter sp. PSR-1]
MAARTLTLMLGLWLFFSAFLWKRAPASFANACAVGLLACAAALWAMWRPRVRLAGVALSAWLLAAALLVPQPSPSARWNDVAVALAMFLTALVPGTMYSSRRATAAGGA